MNAQALNDVSKELFSFKSEHDVTVALNANGKSSTISRDEIISLGRLATLEYFGKLANEDKNNPVKFNSKVNDYATFSRNAWVDTVLFCAAQANKAIGKEPYATMDEVKNDRSMYRNPTFLATLASISETVIYPLIPAILDSSLDRLVAFDRVGLGETKLIDIESNDFFVFDDDSWGSVSSKPYQYLYKDVIALTGKPYTAKCKIKWLQDVIDGDAGRYYAAFARGAAQKMYAIMLERFKKAVATTKYMPTGYTYDGFTMEHWNEALMAAEALNGVSRSQLIAIGTLSSLSKVVPTIGTAGAVAGLYGAVGTEYARNGFLANVSGVDLIETSLAVVPGTQNYKPKYISLDDPDHEAIYIMAKVGRAPMAGVIADGSPITITFTPRETADMTIDISETIVFDIAPAFSSKIMKILV